MVEVVLDDRKAQLSDVEIGAFWEPSAQQPVGVLVGGPLPRRARLVQQRRARSGRVFTSRDNGMVVLNVELDPVTGARVATVIAATERHLFRNEGPAARRTPAQRTADAITKLILEPDTGRYRLQPRLGHSTTPKAEPGREHRHAERPLAHQTHSTFRNDSICAQSSRN
ncbi:hypothetical protein [Candidatus Poriferisodalis sp.]|uniref:hypothetical protein n=1 Tax=Candidatus Poriferisodalis sp. TaxID=3101277 RepID=UPI003D0F7474